MSLDSSCGDGAPPLSNLPVHNRAPARRSIDDGLCLRGGGDEPPAAVEDPYQLPIHRAGEDPAVVCVAITSAGPALIGRDVICAVRIGEPSVSRFHAVLVPRPGWWVIRDLGSRNGTYMNGMRLTPGYPVVLSDGDRLVFGESAEHVVALPTARTVTTISMDGPAREPEIR